MSSDTKADVIVAGLGAHGSATAYHLAKRGKRVIGFDQFRPPHARGSSHGRGRVIRTAYSEGPAYVPIVQRAMQLWRELERESGENFLRITGGITMGPEDSPGLAGIMRSARAYGLPHEPMTAAEIRQRWPVFRPTDGMVGVHEPDNGALFPEKCISAHLKLAAEAGADLHVEEPLLSWKATPGGGVEVRTPKGAYSADRLVLTVGAWLPKMLGAGDLSDEALRPDQGAQSQGGLTLPLRIERQVLHWFEPARNAAAFLPANCPNNSWEFEPGKLFYCQANFGDGFKVAFHHMGVDMDPDSPPGSAIRSVSPQEAGEMRAALQKYIPDAAGRHIGAVVCMYTDTPDFHFIVDLHPVHKQIVIGSPCAGHGFKFAAAMGEILADLALDGRTRHDISLFNVGRFPSQKPERP